MELILGLVVVYILIGLWGMLQDFLKTPEQKKIEEKKIEEWLETKQNQKIADEILYEKKIEAEQGKRNDRLSGKFGQFMSRKAKKKYLLSPRWKMIRQKVLKRDKCCINCKSTCKLQVHHIHYLNLGFEKISDLTILCNTCHSEIHEKLGYSRQGIYVPKKLSLFTNESIPRYEELIEEFDPYKLFKKARILGGGAEYYSQIQKLESWLKKNDIKDIRLKNGVYEHGFPLNVSLGNLSYLEKIVLKGYDFTELPTCFFKVISSNPLCVIETIDLSFNKLTTLPKQIERLENIKSLILDGNNIKTLPVEIKSMVSLEILSINNNLLTHLPKELSEMPLLKKVYVNGNPFLDKATIPDLTLN